MKTKMKLKLSLLALLLSTCMFVASFAQDVPLVYDVENTGANFPKPPLPAINDLPVIEPLTDPFEWSDRSGRSTNFSDWSHRRAEIANEVENYEIGLKPARPDTITARYAGGKLTVKVTVNGNTLTLTAAITLPSGTGPFPAIIGMNSGSGSLPPDIFSSRNIATIAYMHDQVVTYNNKGKSNPYFKLYPNLFYSGEYAPWAWGVSRIIDGLELVQDSLPIDLKHLAVTGCSYAGKMALYAGAFDERIALTIAQESGGGGAAAWRVSQTLGSVENLGATSHQWFMESMFKFAGNNVSKLPLDHHELMAMVAPRALFVLGNPDFVWLADESGYVSCKAAQKVWKTFGIADRFGFSIVGGHGHCNLPDTQKPEVEAFVDKFLLGDSTANTDIATNPYDNVDFYRWTQWWGTGNPGFPLRDRDGSESLWLESECGTVGANWNILGNVGASNESFVTNKADFSSVTEAPADSASTIYLPFTVKTDTIFYLFARLYCPNPKSDSYWIKLDDGAFIKHDGLGTLGWQWLKLSSAALKAGKHTLAIAYCEAGARLDKICISTLKYVPTDKGETAVNICVPDIPTSGANAIDATKGYALDNYPNPFNTLTTIAFAIPNNANVSLKVYNIFGTEVAALAGKRYAAGKHTVAFDAKNLSKGIYFYTLKADTFSASRKMIIQAQ